MRWDCNNHCSPGNTASHCHGYLKKKWGTGWKMLSRSNIPMKPAAVLVLQFAGSQQSSKPLFWVSSMTIVNSSWTEISSWHLCSLDFHSREMPPFLKNSPFAQQLSKDLWDIFLLFCFSLQSHFFSNCVILNANIFIGQVTSGVELLEMREVTSCSVCSVSMAARREVFY